MDSRTNACQLFSMVLGLGVLAFATPARQAPDFGPVALDTALGLEPGIPPGCMVARRVFTNTTQVQIQAGVVGVFSVPLEVRGLGGPILDVVVQTSILHAASGDLDVTLTSPAGTIVTLTTDNGAGSANVFGGTVWSDHANPGGQVPYSSNAGLASDHPYVSGTPVALLAPEEPLGAFADEDPNGTWTLTISDDTAGNGGSLQQWSLAIRTMPAIFGETIVQSNTTAQAIPAGAPPNVVSSSVVVPPGAGPRSVGFMLVTTNITHTSLPDLDVTLQSPAGTVVTLTSDNGGQGSNFAGTLWVDAGNPGGQLPYVFNDGLVTDQNYQNGGVLLPFLAPEEALSAFAGEDPTGTWTLTVSDDGNLNGGTLHSWKLNVSAAHECQSKGDLDSTGTDDLLFRHAGTNEHMVWLMNGVNLLAAGSATITPAPAPTQHLVGSDEFIGAGLFGAATFPELVFYDTSNGRVEFWAMNGPSAARVLPPVPLTGAGPLPLNWKLSATGDFNHDGYADLIWRNVTSQKIVIWTLGQDGAPATQRTGAIVPVPDQATHANWEIVAARDFDHDNNRDLLWYNATSGNIVMWFMDANVARISGTFTSPPSAGDANWRVVAAGDYGPPALGDQIPDIVWRNATSGKLVVWHMNGATNPPARLAGTFTDPDSPQDPLAWTVVGPR